MSTIYQTCFCLAVITILTGKTMSQGELTVDNLTDDADGKRGLGMLRLGRGLQMLRLGKRSANLDSVRFGHQSHSLTGQDNSRLSSADIQAVLDSIFDEPRDESRRQPPLPRYGRDRYTSLDSVRFGSPSRYLSGQDSRPSSSDIQAVLDAIFDEPKDENRRQPPLPRYGRDNSRTASLDLVTFGRQSRSLSGQENSRLSSNDIKAMLDSFFDEPRDESRRQPPLPRYGRDSISNQRSISRPAPRAGRYKRSFAMGGSTSGDYFTQDSAGHVKAIAYPKYGLVIEDLTNLQAKAVSRPKLGRYQIEVLDDNRQTKSA